MTSIQLLDSLKQDVLQLVLRTESEYLTLSDHELNRKASPTSWSVLECYEHLNRYSRFYNQQIEKRLHHQGPVIDVELKSTWIGRKSIEAMHPSNKKQQKTLKHMNPVNGDLSRAVIQEFLQHQRHLLQLLETAKLNDINKIKVPVEFFRLLSMNLGEAFQFIIVHEQRHFQQLQRIVTQSSNPALAV